MTIRKFVAAAAIAGGVSMLGSGIAFADEAQNGVNVANGGKACIELPSSAKPVHAEGLAQYGVRFTLEVLPDGASNYVLAGQSSDSSVNWWADANSYLNPTAFPGTPRECAVNLSGQDAFVVLHLTSPTDGVGSTVSAPSGVVADEPVLGTTDEPTDPPAGTVVDTGTVVASNTADSNTASGGTADAQPATL